MAKTKKPNKSAKKKMIPGKAVKKKNVCEFC